LRCKRWNNVLIGQTRVLIKIWRKTLKKRGREAFTDENLEQNKDSRIEKDQPR